MLRLDVGIVVPYREALRIREGLLKLGGELVETHLGARIRVDWDRV